MDFLEYAPPVDRAKVLLNRGELHGLLGDLAQAKDDCALSLRLALESGPAELVFYATHNLGWYEFLAGNLPWALELMPTGEDALPDFERGIVGMDRAKALLSAGLVTEADRSLIDVCAAFGRTELVQFLAEAELIRAEVALLADQRARPHPQPPGGRPPQAAAAIGEPSRSVNWSSSSRRRCRHSPRRPPGSGRLSNSRPAGPGLHPELGLRDQARLARLIAIELADYRSPGTDGATVAIDMPEPRARMGDGPHAGVFRRSRSEQPLDLRLYNRLVRAKAAYARGHTAAGRGRRSRAWRSSPNIRPSSAVSTCRSPAPRTA